MKKKIQYIKFVNNYSDFRSNTDLDMKNSGSPTML